MRATRNNILPELLAGCHETEFTVSGREIPLAHLVSCELFNMDGNPLHEIIELVAERARAGDLRAKRIVLTLADTIAESTGENEAERIAEYEAMRDAEFDAAHPYVTPANLRSL